MTKHSSLVPTWSFSRAVLMSTVVAFSLGACAVYDDSPSYGGGRGPGWDRPSYPYGEPDVVSVYVEPPLYEPAPIAVPWAPPPMLAEMVPTQPFPGAVWVGGYWVWQGRWVWATGRWAPRPRPDYAWVQPYYEHRDNVVIFIPGHWCPPGVAFVPPPPGFRPRMMTPAPGVRPGVPPIGPPGVFLPPPPGARPGVIVPAPIGTPPWSVRGGPRIREPDRPSRPPNDAVDARPLPPLVVPNGRPFGTMPPPRSAPRQADEAAPPSVRPAWRGESGQPAAPQEPPRDPRREREWGRGVPREQGMQPPRGRDNASEQRPPDAFRGRPGPAASPAPAAPAPVMQAPAPSPGGAGGVPSARREEGMRRLIGPRSDRDRKDQKSE